jgi:elongation factor 1-beta
MDAKSLPAAAKKAAAPAADDDEIDLFGSDEEDDAENEKLKAQRVADYNARKANSTLV